MEIPVWPAARLLWFLHASSRQSTRAILSPTPDCDCPSRKVPAGQLPPRYLTSMWSRRPRAFPKIGPIEFYEEWLNTMKLELDRHIEFGTFSADVVPKRVNIITAK